MTEPSAMLRHARGGLEQVDRVVSLAVIIAMACLVAAVSTQVVMRYVFNSSLDWAWEVSRLCFVASIFLAIPLALKEGSHVGIDLLLPAMSPGLRRAVLLFNHVVMFVLVAIVAVVGFRATANTWNQTLSTIPISTGWFYVPVIWSGFHCALHLIDQGIAIARGENLPPPQDLPPD